MPLIRKSDWQTRLHSYIAAHASTTFQYGVFDCCRFAGGAVEAMTGVKLGQVFDGTYKTRREALEAVKAYCGSPSVLALAQYFAYDNGLPEIPVKAAQRGDIVLIGRGSSASLGVVALHGTEFIGVNRHGLWRAPIAAAARAWRIG